jgi:hypothetical protein
MGQPAARANVPDRSCGGGISFPDQSPAVPARREPRTGVQKSQIAVEADVEEQASVVGQSTAALLTIVREN